MAERLDGKFEIVRELEKTESSRIVEAVDGNARKVRVNWFNVSDPKSRSGFHRYRTAVKNAASPLLLDAVARPGAYYTVWEPLDGISAQTWLEGHPKDEGFRRALRELGDVLESYGFALQDATVLALQTDKEVRPALAELNLADRTTDEIKALNTALLEPSKAARGGLLGKRNPPPAKAPVTTTKQTVNDSLGRPPVPPVKKPPRSSGPPRRRLTVWGIIPGILLLAAVGWFGAQAVATFLEPPTVEVPNVKGKTLQDAAKILSDARLTPRVTEGSDQGQIKGIILAQNPAPGATLTEQRIVEITVNRPRPLLMPNLANKSVGEAKLALKEANLRIGRVAVIPAPDGIARDYVIGQSPPAETEVVRNQGITLLISGSRAPQGKTFIPDLSGLNFDDAKLIVNAAGLRLVDVRTKTSNLPSGTVLSQTPKAYSTVALDTEATVTVAVAATGRKPVIPPPVQPPPPPAPPAVIQPPAVNPPVEPPPAPNPNGSSDPIGANNLPPVTQPDNPVPHANPPAANPQNPEPNTTPPVAGVPLQCPVTFTYTLPADIGTATVEIRVKDDDGERVLLPATPLPGGTPYEQKDFLIRGKATFTVFVDGVSKSVEERDPQC